MFSSVQCGLARLDCPTFIHPADIPGAGADVYQKLVSAFENYQAAVFRPVYDNRPGHPVLLSSLTVGMVQKAAPDTNLKAVLMPLKKCNVTVENDLILYDFNTLEEFEALKARMLSSSIFDKPDLS
jgi:CTP:molybdopterin cytidylyltransferase MocA